MEREWARRIRAAAAYAGIQHHDLAARLGMSDTTLRRTLGRSLRRYEIEALTAEVADICDLPRDFFTIDFARLAELPPSLEERLAAIEAAVGATRGGGEDGEDLGPPAGPLRRELEADDPNERGRPLPSSPARDRRQRSA